MSNAASVGVGLGAVLLISGCVSVPATQEELSNGGSLEAMSAQGLAQGRLNVVGALAPGANDFGLELTGVAPQQTVALEGFDAVMPAHGHRATASGIDPDALGYQILSLRLPMSGVWHLTGKIRVAEQPDEIAFDVDVP